MTPPPPPPPKPPPSPNPRSFKCKRGACPPWLRGRTCRRSLGADVERERGSFPQPKCEAAVAGRAHLVCYR